MIVLSIADDFKHSNHRYIAYTFGIVEGRCLVSRPQRTLVIEQDVRLGKGGICYDAAFIMAEHLINSEAGWAGAAITQGRRPRVIELGAGTGLTGLALTQHCDCDVIVTDLPEFLPIMQRNATANFGSDMHCKGTALVTKLSWGDNADIEAVLLGGAFDVVIAADCVYSLVDREALTSTIIRLSGPHTRVFLTMKERLPDIEQSFTESLFSHFPHISLIKPDSRNVNPGMRLWQASRLKDGVVASAAS
eukprot:scaffold644722_cov45-Prasinocladus_malaysianus.AAC.1